jgi:hypothetical protein
MQFFFYLKYLFCRPLCPLVAKLQHVWNTCGKNAYSKHTNIQVQYTTTKYSSPNAALTVFIDGLRNDAENEFLWRRSV